MQYDELLDNIRAEFPSFEVCPKTESRLITVIDVLLRAITFGSTKDFMTRYTTTIGTTVYTPTSWDSMPETSRMTILRHERVHMQQAQLYGRLLFSLLYLFWPLPLGLAYYRAKFEMEAYTETLQAQYEYHGEAAIVSALNKQFIVGQFTSGAYGWMWPFKSKVEAWYDRQVQWITSKASSIH